MGRIIYSYQSGNRDNFKKFVLTHCFSLIFLGWNERKWTNYCSKCLPNIFLKYRSLLRRRHFVVEETEKNSHSQSQGTNFQNLKFKFKESSWSKLYDLKFPNSNQLNKKLLQCCIVHLIHSTCIKHTRILLDYHLFNTLIRILHQVKQKCCRGDISLYHIC